MNSSEIRSRFLEFFKKRGHTILPSASLVPENDPSVLFTTAGMHPLVPYLMGEKHPGGVRLANSQKCVRTQDIDEVGDNTHDTFFEMLGNWSLGDYFKKEAITWSYEFLTSHEEGLGLDPKRLYFTVFEGDNNAPRDTESCEIWKSLGIAENRIYFRPAQSNWWSPGDNGPCGPDTEMFYDVTGKLGDMTLEEYLKANDDQHIVEIWNDVFMQYLKKDSKVVGKLEHKNVDTGAGLERLVMVMQGKTNIFETDLFDYIIRHLTLLGGKNESRPLRIVADHIRTAVFMIADGVLPGNTDQGYILRRLLRRAVRFSDVLSIAEGTLPTLVDAIAEKYKDAYPNILLQRGHIREVIREEENKFRTTLSKGMKEFEKLEGPTISGPESFILFSTYGFPFELTAELANEKGLAVDESGFRAEMNKHKQLSREGAEGKFKGGLADHSEQSVKYHTATHLLHKALRTVLGEHVFQKGSNITPERLRFDFSHNTKMSDDEKKRVEDLVNEQIARALPVTYEDLPIEEAEKRGAIGLFEEKYGALVRVYKVGDFSLEFCGGPHVTNTKELGTFKIQKEEACSQGIRRIKAILETNK